MIKHKFIMVFLSVFTFFSLAETPQDPKLDKLFDALSKIDNTYDANLLENKIWSVWNKHPSDIGLTDKLELGTELMYEGSYNYALKVFTNIIKTDPSWSEAWNKRATLLFFMKDYSKSLSDIERVLHIEPRHFGALSGRAQIFIAQEEYQKAINDLKKARKIYPKIKVKSLILKLEKLVKGINI